MSHPYMQFEGTALWEAINSGLNDLVENQHLEETSPREYIVGHLYQRIEGLRNVDWCGDC